MCGIAGELRFDDTPPDLAALARMNAQQQARGPDSGGIFAQGAQAWGHRRLKIMDLSESAQQPMFDPALGLGIVFNGAIYNHPELRRELEAKGYDVSARADLSAYTDADQIQSYAAESVAWAVAEGLIQGFEDNTLRPAGNATRAQIATILMRFCEGVAK